MRLNPSQMTPKGILTVDSGVSATVSGLTLSGGDTNYGASTGACEPFMVVSIDTTAATQIVNETTGTATGSSYHDTATLTAATGFPPTGTVMLTHPDCPCSTLQNGTRRCGPASSIGNPRREVPPPEKNNWLVGTKLPANGDASPTRTLFANTIE